MTFPGWHRAPMVVYVVKSMLEMLGVDVLVFDVAWAPTWMHEWRLQKALAWVQGFAEKPGGFASMYDGFGLKELVSTCEAAEALALVESTVVSLMPPGEAEERSRCGGVSLW